jgi:GTP-binding protein Era
MSTIDQKPINRYGYCAIIGRPNVGKSTTFNALLGHSISVVTRKAQTTQTEIMGVVTDIPCQYVMLDTPGVQCRLKRRTKLNRVAAKTIFEADLAIFMVAGSQWTEDDEAALRILKDFDGPVIGCINKIDKLRHDPNKLMPSVERLREVYAFHKIITLSASKNQHIDLLHREICDLLPSGEAGYDVETITSHSEAFVIQEIVRAKALELLHEEIPYDLVVTVDMIKMVKDKRHIYVTLWVKSATQKAVVIGKGGQKLKQIGWQARLQMEAHFQEPLFLKTWVKVGEPDVA